MRRRRTIPQPSPSDPLTLIAGTWLASGTVLLGLTPLPAYDANWGWSPVFWLLLAPAIMLCARRLSTGQPLVAGRLARRQNLPPISSGVARRRTNRGFRAMPVGSRPGKSRDTEVAAA